MGWRASIQKNPALTAVIGLAVIAGCVFWILQSGSSPSLPKQVYYLDLGTNQLFAGDVRASSPIRSPSGGEGVKALAYRCGGCDGGEPQVAYLMSTRDAAAMVALPPTKENPSPAWVLADSIQGMAIADRLRDICGNQPASECFPR